MRLFAKDQSVGFAKELNLGFFVVHLFHLLSLWIYWVASESKVSRSFVPSDLQLGTEKTDAVCEQLDAGFDGLHRCVAPCLPVIHNDGVS